MHPLQQLPRKNWPAQVSDIAEVIGDEAAMALFIRFNGRHLGIPLTCPAGHLIEEIIGAEKAALLCKTFARETVLFPKGAYLLRKSRNQNIVEDWKNGMTQSDLATKYDMSSRNIFTIIDNYRTENTHV
ncbi:MAG: hypothetical protein BVN35_20380 [Proteobacteria bacterium ST_bin11]|nr:MAG: hypothetical protein BVN35_20380 [Proteobacteria bacterium ST_bin11]